MNKVKASKNCPPQGFQTRQQLLATINSENSVSKNFPRIFVYRQQRKGQWFVSKLVVRIIIAYENVYLRRSVLYRAPSSHDVSPFLSRARIRAKRGVVSWYLATKRSVAKFATRSSFVPPLHPTSHLYSPARYLRSVTSWMLRGRMDLVSRVSPFIFKVETVIPWRSWN